MEKLPFTFVSLIFLNEEINQLKLTAKVRRERMQY